MNQAGFRHDQSLSLNQQITLQGDLYKDQIGPEFENIQAVGQEDYGGNFLTRWRMVNTKDFQQDLTAYYDRTYVKITGFIDRRKIMNVDYLQTFRWKVHETVWGIGYRQISDEIETFPTGYIQPTTKTDRVKSAFAQDDWLLKDDWHLILGTKFEVNDYSNTEWQPSIRTDYQWLNHFVWVAWSKAVRTPSRLERDVTSPALPNFGATFDPEYVSVKEIGWRYSPTVQTRISISLYYANYTNLLSNERTHIGNGIKGRDAGGEISLSHQASSNWLLKASFSKMNLDLNASSNSLDTSSAEISEGSSPKNQFVIASMWDINERWQLNTYLRYVDALEAFKVKSYCVADITLNWRPKPAWDLQWVAHHIGDKQHAEWAPRSARSSPNSEVEADLSFNATWRFN